MTTGYTPPSFGDPNSASNSSETPTQAAYALPMTEVANTKIPIIVDLTPEPDTHTVSSTSLEPTITAVLPPPPKAPEQHPPVRVDLLRPKAMANPPSRVSTGTLLRMESGVDPTTIPGAYIAVGHIATTPPQPSVSPRTAHVLRSQNDSLQAQLQTAVEQLHQLSI